VSFPPRLTFLIFINPKRLVSKFSNGLLSTDTIPVQTGFDYLYGWRLYSLPGQLSHCKILFPDVQREAPVFQVVPIASGPVTGHHSKKPGSIFIAPSLQVFLYIGKILPKPSLLQAGQSQLSQPVLTQDTLQSLHHLRGPSLDFPPPAPVCPCLLRWEPRTGHSTPGVASPEQSRGEGSPLSTRSQCSNADEGTICFLCHQGTWLARVQPDVQQQSQVLFCQAAFQLGGPQYTLCPPHPDH